MLAFTAGSYDIMRGDGAGGWYAQYSVSSPRDMYVYSDPVKGLVSNVWNYLGQQHTVEWTGYYAP
jgi:hypothetical protein